MKIIALTSLLLLVSAGTATAQDTSAEAAGKAVKQHVAFVEASGGYGFQFGEQDYMPTTDGTYKNPLTNGYAFGLTAGWEFIPGVSLIGNWEYAKSQSLNGEVTNVLDKVDGIIDYHTISIGVRWTREIGPGRLFGELAAGVVLPFETEVVFEYNAAMSAVDISGSGRMIDGYNLGFGAYGQAGYQWNLTPDLYVSAGLRVKSYQSDNDGKERRYQNFLDMENLQAPQTVTTTIKYNSDGSAGTQPPRTYSAQDLRALLSVGFRL